MPGALFLRESLTKQKEKADTTYPRKNDLLTSRSEQGKLPDLETFNKIKLPTVYEAQYNKNWLQNEVHAKKSQQNISKWIPAVY